MEELEEIYSGTGLFIDSIMHEDKREANRIVFWR